MYINYIITRHRNDDSTDTHTQKILCQKEAQMRGWHIHKLTHHYIEMAKGIELRRILMSNDDDVMISILSFQ